MKASLPQTHTTCERGQLQADCAPATAAGPSHCGQQVIGLRSGLLRPRVLLALWNRPRAGGESVQWGHRRRAVRLQVAALVPGGATKSNSITLIHLGPICSMLPPQPPTPPTRTCRTVPRFAVRVLNPGCVSPGTKCEMWVFLGAIGDGVALRSPRLVDPADNFTALCEQNTHFERRAETLVHLHYLSL